MNYWNISLLKRLKNMNRHLPVDDFSISLLIASSVSHLFSQSSLRRPFFCRLLPHYTIQILTNLTLVSCFFQVGANPNDPAD